MQAGRVLARAKAAAAGQAAELLKHCEAQGLLVGIHAEDGQLVVSPTRGPASPPLT